MVPKKAIDPDKMVMLRPEVIAASPQRLEHYRGMAGHVKYVGGSIPEHCMIFWPSLQHSSLWASSELMNVPKDDNDA